MLFLSLFTATAWPCAGLFHEEGLLAESDVQEAIFEQTADGVQVSYLAQYDGDAASFGWVIPIFGEFQSIEDGDPERFTELREQTQPTVYRSYAEEEPACGCGATAGKADNSLGDTAATDRGFDVVAEGFTGTFDYAVIEGDDAQGILDWLDQNGWQIADSEAAISAYVAEGGVRFVALSLAPQSAETSSEGRQLPPVVIQYAGDSMRFPATMARYGAVAEVRTTLWVLGEQQARVGGWSQTTLSPLEGSIDEEPEQVWLDGLRAMSAQSPVYNLTWAGDYDGAFLTRFDTLAPKEVHTLDVTFTADGGTNHASTEVWLYEESSSSVGLLMLPLALLGAGLRRRR